MAIRFAYTALQVGDIDASEKFYTSVLGMRRRSRKKVEETRGEKCVLASGRNTLELNWYEGAPSGEATAWTTSRSRCRLWWSSAGLCGA